MTSLQPTGDPLEPWELQWPFALHQTAVPWYIEPYVPQPHIPVTTYWQSVLREPWPKPPEKSPWAIHLLNDVVDLPVAKNGICNLARTTWNLIHYGMGRAFKIGEVVRITMLAPLPNITILQYPSRIGIVLDYKMFPSQEPGCDDSYEYTVLVGMEKLKVPQTHLVRG